MSCDSRPCPIPRTKFGFQSGKAVDKTFINLATPEWTDDVNINNQIIKMRDFTCV
jgi:hypothetical protein